MIHTSFSLLSPSIPILLIPAGSQSSESQDIVKKVSREPFRILSRNQKELITKCANLNIPCPKEFWAQFFPCYTLADYIFLSSRFISEKSLYFYQYISVIIFIDMSENNSYELIREEYLKIVNKAFPIGFFIYKAKESDVDLASETTYLFLENYPKDKIQVHIRTFGNNFVIKSILQNTIFTSTTRLPCDMNFFPIRVSLLFVSANINEILAFFENDVKKNIKTENKMQLAPFFEVCAILDRIFPEFIQKIQISDLFWMGKAPWVNNESELTTDISKSLSVSGYLYFSSNNYIKSIDCGLRCVSYGFTTFLNQVVSLIMKHPREPLIKYWAIEAVLLATKLRFSRKAALFAYEFSQSLPDIEKLSFIRYCLLTIQNYSQISNSKLQYEVAVPLIMILKDTDVRLCTEITAEILTDFGPKLPLIFQRQLFQSLSFFSSEILIQCKLYLKLCSVKIEKSQYFIRPKVNQGNQNQSVFIYNYYTSKSNSEKFSGVNQPIRFLIKIKNNFQVPLPISISFPSSDDYECDEITYHLHPTDPNLVSVVVIPTKIQKYVFSSIRCSLFGLQDIINLPETISISVIDSPANYNASTDLPIYRPIEGYIGEIVDFTICINNQGKFPITSVSTYLKNDNYFLFDATYDQNELPLDPMSELEITCHLQFTKIIDLFEFEVSCSSENSDYEFVVIFKQPLSIISGLLPKSIYPIQNPPLILNSGGNSMILIALEIENTSDETFSYNVNFDVSASKNEKKNSEILTNKNFHNILGSKKRFIHLCPIVKNDLLEQMKTIQPDDPRVIKAAREAELKYGISGSIEERQKIVQLANLQIFLQNHLSFKWTSVDNCHHGVLPFDMALPDLSYLDEIEKKMPNVTIRFLVDNEELKEIPAEKIVDVVVDFDDFLINKCSIDIKKYANPAFGLIWDGKLVKDDVNGLSKFSFRLCFCIPGLYELPIHYSSGNNSVVGSDIAIINVVKYE